MAQKFLSGLQATIGSVGTPGISFVGYADTGLYRTTYDTTKDALDFAIDGVRRGRIFEAGIEAFGNLYFNGDVRTFGSLWHATTGATGVGFAFTNTADSTDALTLSSGGNAVFGGTMSATSASFSEGVVIADIIDGDFTALRLMNQKTYGAGTGTNEHVRFAMGISESGTAFSGREGFVIDLRVADQSDSSDGIVDFKVRDGGVIGTYSTVTGTDKSISFVGNATFDQKVTVKGASGLEILNGTNGTSSKLLFRNSDNNDASAFIRKEAYWMQLSAHQNEGFKFTDTTNSTILLQLNGGNQSGGNGTNSATFLGSVNVKSARIDWNSVTSATATTMVANVLKATYSAVFFDFLIKNGTNVRAGTITAAYDGTDVEFTETSTVDLGDTSDVTLSVEVGNSTIFLQAVTTSSTWTIKSLIRAL